MTSRTNITHNNTVEGIVFGWNRVVFQCNKVGSVFSVTSWAFLNVLVIFNGNCGIFPNHILVEIVLQLVHFVVVFGTCKFVQCTVVLLGSKVKSIALIRSYKQVLTIKQIFVIIGYHVSCREIFIYDTSKYVIQRFWVLFWSTQVFHQRCNVVVLEWMCDRSLILVISGCSRMLLAILYVSNTLDIVWFITSCTFDDICTVTGGNTVVLTSYSFLNIWRCFINVVLSFFQYSNLAILCR